MEGSMQAMNGQTPRQQVMTRLGLLKSERSSWWQQWVEISTYLLPRSGRYFQEDRNKGYKRHNNIYDNSGTRSLRVLAAGLMGGLTSPARPWFRLTVGDEQLAEQADVKQWLSLCTRVLLDVFAKSNFYRVAHGMYQELGAFGTGAAIVVPDFDNVIHLYPMTVGEYAIQTDWKGQVVTLYREFEKTVGEVVKEFGIENVSDHTRKMFEQGSLDKWVKIVHAIEPREDRDPSKLDNLNMAWRSIYFEVGGKNDTPLRESGFKRFPCVVPRWDVTGGDVYGNGPGMEALGDIKQLQQEQLRKSQAIDYQSNPPIQVPSQLKNRDVDRFPGGVTFYDTSAQSPGIKTMFEVNLDINHLSADIQDVRQRISNAFYADLFLMISQVDDGRMTATEVAERHEEKMLMLGPVLERLHNEFLQPVIDLAFDAVMDAGILPPPPPAMQGKTIDVELVSMLAQAQKAISTNAIDRFVQSMGMIAQMKPEVLDKLDADAWADHYADVLGVDPELIVPEAQVQATRQQRAQAQAQQAQAAQQEQMANSAAKLGQVQTQGGQSNAANDILGLFSGYGSPQGA
jgi:hypothetical protein